MRFHPNGDEASWKLLAGCAIALPKKQASAITEAFISATDLAEQEGRVDVSYEDIEAAISLDFPAAGGEEPAAVERPRSGSAMALQQGCRPAAERPLSSSDRKKTAPSRLARPEGVFTA